jgi:hypothetical protein
MDSPIVARVVLGLLGVLMVHSCILFVRGRLTRSTFVDQDLTFVLLVALFWERAAGVDSMATASASSKISGLMVGLLVGRLRPA